VVRGAATATADDSALLQQLCRAADVDAASVDEALEALLNRLGTERERRGAPPIVVVEQVAGSTPAGGALASLAGAALWTRSFQLVLAGAPGVRERLARAGVDPHGEGVREVTVPALDREGVARHVRGWLDAALDPLAAPLLVTRDALLLVAHRSRGALERVNCLLHNMAWLAAHDRRRTLSSWHAWAAPDRERWVEGGGGGELPRPPPGWPPPDVVDLLDACRRAAGMPPWPRARPQQRTMGATE
jgi:hypothetical protein